jgi:hypothetical protein
MSLSSIVSQYRKELLQLEQQSEKAIRSSHDNMMAMIRQFLSKLYAQLKQLIPVDQLKWLQGSQLQHTKQTVTKHVGQFSNVAQAQVLSSQKASIHLGVQAAQAQLATIAPSAVINTPAQSDLHKLIGVTQQSNSILDLMGSYGDDAADKVGDALVSGVSTGKDTSVIADLITAALMTPLYRALTTDQTSMMEAYRSGVLMTFQDNSSISQLWQWSALPGACSYCSGMDGTIHSIDETMESHPNCRCQMIVTQ